MSFVLFILTVVGIFFMLPPLIAMGAVLVWTWSRWAEFCFERIYWRRRRRAERPCG